MPESTDIRPHQTADFDQNFAKVNTDLDRFLAVFRDVRANGPGPRELDIAGLAGHLTEIGTVPGLADLLAAAIVRLAEPAPAAELTPEQAEAERIIRSAVEDIEMLTIAEMAAADTDPDRIDDLIRSATVTVTWAQDAEQAGDA